MDAEEWRLRRELADFYSRIPPASRCMARFIRRDHVLVLRNHGIAVCERDIPTTFMLLWTVQRAAEVQCQSAAIQGESIAISDEIRQRCGATSGDLAAGVRVARIVWDGSVRRMRAQQGSRAS